MKKTFLFCLFLVANSFAQDTIKVQRFPAKTTLLGAKKILKEQIAEIERILNFSSIEIAISSAKKPEKVIKDEFLEERSFLVNDENAMKEKLRNYYNSRTFLQIMTGNSSFLQIDDGSYSARDYLKEEFDVIPKITDLKIYFYDKSSKTISFEVKGDRCLIPFGKRIEKIEINYSYTFPEKTVVNLSLLNKTYKDKDRFIDLITLAAGKAKIQLSDTLHKSIVAIAFFNKDNKQLRTSGSNYNSKPSDASLAFYNDLQTVFKSVIADIDAKKIISVKALEENLHQKTIKLKPNTESSNVAFSSYQVNGMPTSMSIYLSEKTKKIQGKATLLKKDYDKQVGPYFIATDTLTKKQGFVDADGKWFKKDIGDQIEHVLDNYYSVSNEVANQDKSYEFENKIHKIDLDKKEVVKYTWNYLEQIAPNILKIQSVTNEAYEIFDRVTTKKILPNKYGFIDFKDGVFVVRESEFTYGDGKYGAFTSEGEVILPCIYDTVSSNGKFLYVKNLKTDRTQAFSINGKPITPENLSVESEFGKDGIAIIKNNEYNPVVTNKKGEKIYSSNPNFKKNYINTKGEVVLDTAVYKDITTFSNGLAAVENKDGLFGYINTSGKLVIPCIYDRAYPFQTNYAFVENTAGENLLIDKQNKVHKTFVGHYSSVSFPADSNNAEYNINGSTYDADGNKK
jgi:hypothetical protein